MAKLTLSINERAIESGKEYASAQGRTLSSIVEDYLGSLVSQRSDSLATQVQALMGIGRGPADESDYRRHLLDKHALSGQDSSGRPADKHTVSRN